MKQVAKPIIDNAMEYTQYRQLTDDLLEQGKTTGENHSDAMIKYTQLNVTRMKRLDKTTKLTEETVALLNTIERPLIWLVITEAWCGDAAQVIPIIEQMAGINPKIKMKLVLRDEHLDLMDAFLTNGSRSIPKLVFLDAETLEVLGSWGPRPGELQQLVMESKVQIDAIEDIDEKKVKFDDLKKDVQKWYARDKTKGIQRDILSALNSSLAISV